ncbi:hypothetical protein, partial [Winogradskyella sp.]|uniref:hypothetical protein n=1 Tax=Winogradskyella sp. TaxID=1883156 RepID=UPI0025E228A9
ILDPNFYDTAEFVDDDFKDKFDNVDGVLKQINYFLKEAADNKRCICTIDTYKYRFLPPFYGVSFDDKYLFTGNTFWENGKLKSSGQSY